MCRTFNYKTLKTKFHDIHKELGIFTQSNKYCLLHGAYNPLMQMLNASAINCHSRVNSNKSSQDEVQNYDINNISQQHAYCISSFDYLTHVLHDRAKNIHQ